MTVDLFATRYNAQLPLFGSPFSDNTVVAMDGLAAIGQDKT